MRLKIIHLWQVPSTVLVEADVVINVGVSGPGVVQRAVEKVPGESFDVLAETVKKTASKSHVLVSWLVKWPVNVLVSSSVL